MPKPVVVVARSLAAPPDQHDQYNGNQNQDRRQGVLPDEGPGWFGAFGEDHTVSSARRRSRRRLTVGWVASRSRVASWSSSMHAIHRPPRRRTIRAANGVPALV